MSDHTAQTELPGVNFAALRQATLAEAAEHDLHVEQDGAQGIVLGTYYGRIAFAPSGAHCRAEISTARADFLQTLKDSLVDQIGSVMPDAARAIRWSDGVRQGALPDNARLMTVQHREMLDCGFMRVTLAGDVARFSDSAIHFRLGIAQPGKTPQWPRIGENGATVWPKGEHKLHLPVYTARRVDRENGLLVFDLFIHEGGRTTDWARSVELGTQILVTGPGGGGCTITGPVFGFADDTAFPAIARIMEANPDLTGRIMLYPSHVDAAHYPFPKHKGLVVVIASEAARPTMGQAACDAVSSAAGGFLWFAGQKALATQVRKTWKEHGGAAERSYISAFW